jgi:ankyrin repeat protein
MQENNSQENTITDTIRILYDNNLSDNITDATTGVSSQPDQAPLEQAIFELLPESTLIWKQGDTISSTGSVLVRLAQNGYTREAHQIIGLSRTASLIGRDSNGGLPELWDIMGKVKGKGGITRLMAICITRGPDSPQRALSLIRDHTIDISAKDDNGRTALYHALNTRRNNNEETIPINIELIKVLITACPKLVQEVDHFDKYPIYTAACESLASIEVIDLLLKSYPEGAIQMMNSYHHNLLHLVFERHSDFNVKMLLATAYPKALVSRDYEGNLPTHYNPPWTSMYETTCLLELCPDIAKNETRWGNDLPLHIVSSGNDANIEMIKYLISVYPEGLCSRNDNGRSPLHIAISSGAPIDVINYLLDQYPEAIQSYDIDTYDYQCDKLPLMLALSSDSSLTLVKLLVNAYPKALQLTDRNDRLPLHIAICSGAPFNVIEFILNEYPKAATIYDSYFYYDDRIKNNLPIHYALSPSFRNEISIDIIKLLLAVYPESILQKSRGNLLPIEIARSSHAPREVIELLTV